MCSVFQSMNRERQLDMEEKRGTKASGEYG